MKQSKTKLFLFTILLMFANVLLAQISVSGNVVDQMVNPYRVTILDENDNTKGTVTDFDGNFTIGLLMVVSMSALLVTNPKPFQFLGRPTSV